MVAQEIALEDAVKIDSESKRDLLAELKKELCDLTKDKWYKPWFQGQIKGQYGNWYGGKETLMSGAVVQTQVLFQGDMVQVRMFYAHQPGILRVGDDASKKFEKGTMRVSTYVGGEEKVIYSSNGKSQVMPATNKDLNGYTALVKKVIDELKNI